LIRKYKKLPTEPIQSPSGFSEYQVPQLAFGHDPVNDDYKVLRVVQFFKSGEFPSAFEMKAYSLKADSWRRVEGKWPYKESYIPTNLESLSSASLNGVVHWLVTSVIEDVHHAQTLVAFNLATEKFRVYTLPVHSTTNLALEVLGGRILLRIVGIGDGSGNEQIKNLCYHFWAMMEYMMESSWTWLYCDKYEWNSKWNLSHCKPLLISEDGNKVLIEQNFQSFYWYDIKKKSRSNKIRNMPCLFE
jgi:F-box interacting protein